MQSFLQESGRASIERTYRAGPRVGNCISTKVLSPIVMAWLKLTHRYLNTDHISEVRLHESELTVVFDRPSPRGRAGAETENLEGSDAQVLRDWLEGQDESA